MNRSLSTPSSQWLDEQYDNRARVPEHGAIFERWRAASALSRDRSAGRLDLRYGDTSGQTLDLFAPREPGAPLLMFVHGGYWRSLDKADHSFVAPSFLADGAAVAIVNHDLCPAVTVDTIALQAAQAVAWLWRHAAEHGIDRERIVVAGHSAGGHLAAMLLGCDWPALGSDLPPHLVRAAVSISGLFDLEPLRHTPSLQTDLRLTPESAPRLSPAAWPAPEAAKLHAWVGADESEEFLRQSALIRERWGAAAVPVCETVPGTHHFDVLHLLADPHSRMHALTRSLLGLT